MDVIKLSASMLYRGSNGFDFGFISLLIRNSDIILWHQIFFHFWLLFISCFIWNNGRITYFIYLSLILYRVFKVILPPTINFFILYFYHKNHYWFDPHYKIEADSFINSFRFFFHFNSSRLQTKYDIHNYPKNSLSILDIVKTFYSEWLNHIFLNN